MPCAGEYGTSRRAETVNNPKLRPVGAQWINHNGQQLLLLRDRLGLVDQGVAVPPALIPLLELMDGERDAGRLRAAFQLHTGIPLPASTLESLLRQFDEALLLEGPRYRAALAAAVAEYRSLPQRPLAVAGRGYPEDAGALAEMFAGYCDGLEEPAGSGAVRGLISPHIDYQRGGRVYARTWLQAAAAVREADLVVAFGTDHAGGPGALTLSRQAYATPWGRLPLAEDVVEALADSLGAEAAFAEELNHRSEHSLELALNWLHYVRKGKEVAVAPVLCGSFQPFTHGGAAPDDNPAYAAAMAAVREVATGRRLFVVAAADLAHIGPTFDDPRPVDAVALAALRAADERRLAAAASGEAEAFLAVLRGERDCQRVCGLPPIYFALRLLDGARGEVVAYEQCPAEASSVVSIAGVVFK